jgi:hypothetical protein
VCAYAELKVIANTSADFVLSVDHSVINRIVMFRNDDEHHEHILVVTFRVERIHCLNLCERCDQFVFDFGQDEDPVGRSLHPGTRQVGALIYRRIALAVRQAAGEGGLVAQQETIHF